MGWLVMAVGLTILIITGSYQENHRTADAHGKLAQLCIAAERTVAESIPHQVNILQDLVFFCAGGLVRDPFLKPLSYVDTVYINLHCRYEQISA